MTLPILNKYLTYFNKYPEIISIALVGSAVHSQNPTDIDLMLITTNQSETVKSIRDFAANSQLELTVSDDAYRLKEGQQEVSLVPKSKLKLDSQVKQILLHPNLGRLNLPWAVGGFFPEVFLQDLLSALVLHEIKPPFITNLQSTIKNNLDQYLSSLCLLLTDEIKLKSSLFQTASKFPPIYKQTLENDLLIARARLDYASRGTLFPGLKHFSD